MADPSDPSTPIDPNAAQNLDAAAQAARSAQDAFASFGGIADKVKDQLDGFKSKVMSLKDSLDKNAELTADQTTAFGLLSIAAVGVRNSFEGLENIDSSSLSTFTSQFKELQQVITKDSAFSSSSDKVNAFISVVEKLGVKVPTEILKGGFGAVVSYGEQLAASADNGLKLENALIQLASKTGALNAVYGAAGPNLQNINLLLAQQQKGITDTSTATGVSTSVIEQYYSQLGAVPKALSATVKGTDGMGTSVNLLTAVMQYATGSGRKFSEVVDDMKIAFRDYNITGEEALKFTARMGELSNKFGVELSDVRDSIRGTADTFKMFGNEAEGAAAMMNEYLGAIESTGVSGHVALDVVRNMTEGIKGLGIAQKSFLSAQTGGAGGLMGAFQIEKELREGKIDKVFDRVRQTLGKEFGKIVTLEEASQSQAAAAQLTKQIMLLRQGPLGSFAKDDQSAIRLLEGFRAKQEGKAVSPELGANIVQDTMKSGISIEKQSYTELTRIRAAIEALRGTANIANLGFSQTSFAAGIGQQLPDNTGDIASEMRDNLTQNMMEAATKSGQTAIQTGTALTTKVIADKGGQFAYQNLQDLDKLYDQLGIALKAPIDNLKRLVSEGKGKEAQEAAKSYLRELDERRNAVLKSNENNKLEQINQIDKTKTMLVDMMSITKKPNTGLLNSNIPKIDYGDLFESSSANTRLANAVKNTSNGVNAPTGASAGPSVIGQAHHITQSPSNLGELTVHVEGYCLDCGEKMRSNTQSFAINTGQKAKK